MNANLKYEIRAEAFRLQTGQMAPGKDPPPEKYPAPFEERMSAWEKWNDDNKELLTAIFIAFDHILDDNDM